MSLEYIRDYYKVPAHMGSRIEFDFGKARHKGTVIGSKGPYVIARPDGTPGHVVINLHPTYNVKYLPPGETI